MKINQMIRTKYIKQLFCYILLVATILLLSACEYDSDSSLPASTPSISDDIPTTFDCTEPTLVLSDANVKPGNKAVEVIVEIKNNPGILGIDFDVHFDSSVLTLVDAKSELNVEGCSFTAPSYYRNPTTFLWDFQDANWVEDGSILKLYFDVSELASIGEYEVKIMYSYGNIFDANGTPIDIKVQNANISVE